MRILHVVWYFPPVVGGVEVIVKMASVGLASRGHDVTVLTSKDPSDGVPVLESIEDGVRVIRLSAMNPGVKDAESAKFLRGFLESRFESESFDVVHGTLLTYPMAIQQSFALLEFFDRRGWPVVDHAQNTHERDPDLSRAFMSHRCVRELVAVAGHVDSRMRAIQAREVPLPVRERFRHDHDWDHLPELSILSNPVDTSLFHPDPEFGAVFRREWGIPNEEFLVVNPSRIFDLDGSLSALKVPLTVIDAFGSLCRLRRDCRLLFIAPPGFSHYSTTKESWERIHARVEQWGIADRILFLGRGLSHREMMQAYNAADASLIPSAEPFGLVFVESMACETPVVGVRAGAGPEIGVDRAGVLVPPGKGAAHEMGRALAVLAADPDLRRKLGAQGRLIARERFEKDRWIEDLEKILVRVFGRCAATPG